MNRKGNLSESVSKNEAADFSRFIVFKSLKETCQANLSLFVIEKVISSWATSRSDKNTRNGNFLVKVDSQKHAKNILKMKTFHRTKSQAYPCEKLNTSKRVITSRELSLATAEEITTGLGKQGATDIKRIIRKGRGEIQTNTYILMFNQLKITLEVRIRYSLERVEQHIPHVLGTLDIRYIHHDMACWRHQICKRGGEKDPDHIVEDWLNESKCPNNKLIYAGFSRSCDI